MNIWDDDADGLRPCARRSYWRVAVFALIAAIPLLLLLGCASPPKPAPAADDGLWEIRNHYPLSDGMKGPSRDLFKFIAGPGCRDFGPKVICPDRGTGWHFAAEFENGRLVATWQQRRVGDAL